MAYGIEEFDKQNPFAWPAFAKGDDVQSLPPTRTLKTRPKSMLCLGLDYMT